MGADDRAVSPRNFWLRRNVSGLAEWSGMTEHVRKEIVGAVKRLKGSATAQVLRRCGLRHLHEVIDALDFAPLRDQVLERLRRPLLAIAVAVGREILGWEGDFYVDDYLILRINFPFEVARLADPLAENPGMGRVSPEVRKIFRARKIIDPVYDPKSYHRGHPPAAWAHGPHRDSWAGHSMDDRQIWWAIDDVPTEAGMVLYPELVDENVPCDPRTLCIRAGYPLPKPTCISLRAGEMLVFNTRVPHGTHLNTTSSTRVVVSMRLSEFKPAFDPVCFYAHEFWRRAIDIESGRDEVLHLRREDHLGPAGEAHAPKPRRALPVIAGVLDPASESIRGIFDPASAAARRVIVEAPPYRMMVVRMKKGLKAYDTACPHYGVDLADGACDDDKAYCPACGVAFDLQTGQSSCPSLTLRPYEAWEDGEGVLVRIAP